MTKAEATANVFMLALKALPDAERDAVVARIARDRRFGRDLVDLATIERRRKEPARGFRAFLAERARGS